MRVTGSRRFAQWLLVLLVALYAALAASYFVLRYAGQWTDSDTANLTAATAGVMNEGTLLARKGRYALGFAYQVVSAFIVTVSGLSVTQLQLLVYPIVAAGLSLVAFAMYREFTGDAAAGALATLLLFLQPDFLFVILRGSHEKVVWLMVMLAVLLLAKSFGAVRQLPRLAAYVGLFYVAVFALIASNAFFGSSFIVAVAVGLIAGFLMLRISKRWRSGKMTRPTVPRLLSVVASATVVWVLNTFYLYPPAARIFLDLSSATDRTAAVALGYEPRFDPYASAGWGWVSQTAYLGLILPSLIIGGISFIVWILAGWRLLRGEKPPEDPPQFLLWLLYGGFGLQLAIGIILDQAGAIGGNLQLRFFPVAMLMACGLVAPTIVRLWRRQTRGLKSRLLAVGLALVIIWASGASLLKATNDPWLSNYWRFWTLPEDRALQWVDAHLQYRRVWVGLDGIRLSSHAFAEGLGDDTGNEYETWSVDIETRDLLLASPEEGLSMRRSIPLPDARDEHRVYDNGTVAHYHLRPRTPYQK